MTQAILRWRMRLRLSQVEAARLLGCSRPALRSWERGLTRTPAYIKLACAAIEAEIAPIK